MQIIQLLDAANAISIGTPFQIPERRQERGNIPFLVYGTFVGTVVLEATIASQQEVEEGTASWVALSDGSWTTSVADCFYGGYTHIRGRVTAYTSGSISMRIWI